MSHRRRHHRRYPHGKRQRAREAALWAVDPPSYFTEGVYVALKGPAYSAAEMDSVYRRFPEWSPQRHMYMDAPQRQARAIPPRAFPRALLPPI